MTAVLLARIAALREHMNNELDIIAGHLRATSGTAPKGAVEFDSDLVEISVIAQRLGRSKEATRKWARRNGVAVRHYGRLYVSETRVRALMRT